MVQCNTCYLAVAIFFKFRQLRFNNLIKLLETLEDRDYLKWKVYTIHFSCNHHYFAVGEKCVSENLVIGVTVGIGGAIIIGLFIGIIVIGFRLKKTKKK